MTIYFRLPGEVTLQLNPKIAMRPFGTDFFITLLGAVVAQSRSNSKAISRNSNPNRRTPNLNRTSAQPVINEDPRHVNLTASEHGSNNLVSHARIPAQSLYQCSKSASPDEMKLTFLRNTAVTCNDGTPAGFYIRVSRGSKQWLIFFRRYVKCGDWYCYNKESCDARYRTSPRLMSSAEWPLTQKGSGILSAEPEENPHWWNANTV
ncbi:inactive palmitoleoyl-protein carboxylesterase notum1b, partial [Rhincodon typus]|uniref:inactive palmitoleoyl-protein carboxylesterase notum1b n=1 Tax=Rhincodon typus TaxID=259920 RepID=UPI002030AAFB